MDAVLHRDGIVGTMMVLCPDGQAQLENAGCASAVNVHYDLTPTDPASTVARPNGLKFPRSITAHLTTTWREFSIDLTGKDLTHLIGGFAWVASADSNPGGVTFYLDDNRFEKK
jgi:hypothetical protein